MLDFSVIYADVADMHEMNNKEQVVAAQLRELYKDRPLNDVSRDRFARVLDEGRAYLDDGDALAEESLANIKDMGALPSRADLDGRLKDARTHFGDCVKAPKI